MSHILDVDEEEDPATQTGHTDIYGNDGPSQHGIHGRDSNGRRRELQSMLRTSSSRTTSKCPSLKLEDELVRRRNDNFATMMYNWSAIRSAPKTRTRGRGGERAVCGSKAHITAYIMPAGTSGPMGYWRATCYNCLPGKLKDEVEWIITPSTPPDQPPTLVLKTPA